ncbi:Ribosomal large subunit pseudouridine synthase C [BD1-7 clade bacterium]|uniref:Pseudouridine synthase n=1 Tax=BD1-7 clade bacterium TaxID=2029982 RepID=A0A5S9NTG4_9GAMM|nr:Ribosomal large subunit pseudouridine synthase C [BD1-7 clade bacterium]CAA0109174.1 Ribosomal large subunit pseudouridine synthase C [BD1-7 clade bacterium]
MSKDVDSPTTASKVRWVDITEDDAGQRLDNFLFRILKGVPKSRVYRALRHGEVRINKKRVKADYRLQAGDLLRVPPVRVAERPAVFVSDKTLETIENAIVYEDEQILVVNKPSGIAVHGGSGVDFGLIEAVRKLRPDCKRLELAHRLDRDTSGLTIIVKKSQVLRFIHQQLREKSMEKTYLALVKGRWPRRKTQVDVGLQKNVLKSGERMVYASPEGKPSKTLFRIAEVLQGATLIEASPVTGRTHQIRVHGLHAGFPLLGDSKYGDDEVSQFARQIGLERLFLHASRVSFRLPDRAKPLVLEAPLPDELKSIVEHLRLSADGA